MAEETGELLGDAQLDDECLPQRAAELIAMTASAPGATRIAALLKTGNPHMQKLAAALLVKAKHSQGDQALVDMALCSCDRCLKIDGLSVEENAHMARACDHLREAGAAPSEISSLHAAGNIEQMEPPPSDFRPGDNAIVDSSEGSGAITAAGGKRGRAHQNLMDIAHECISKMTGGMACAQLLSSSDLGPAPAGSTNTEEVAKAGARHSAETMAHLRAAHGHLLAAGTKCDAAGIGEEECQGTEFESVKALRTKDLAKVLADERAEKTALVKALGEMVPLLDRPSKRVDDIARTPLPPLTIARGAVSVSKQQDGGNTGNASDSPLSPEAIASALAKMSKEEQTLTLIKASYANPIPVLGAAAGER